jgi:3-methyladenine DNA glycosylase AlkD
MAMARKVDEILDNADELAGRFEAYEPKPVDELRARLRAAMSAAGDPVRAKAQQAYLKSDMPHYGIPSPDLKVLLKPFLAEFKPANRAEWEQTVRTLWDGATHREELYAAIGFAQHKAAKQWQDADTLGLYEHMIVTGAWWDLVDTVAGDLVGGVLSSYRRKTTPVVREWVTSDDLWLRRSAVICQLHHGADTDLDLLTYAIEENLEDTSFWLRKAIGWALRQYARTDPEWVRSEVDLMGSRLSGLSRREALKHLGGSE